MIKKKQKEITNSELLDSLNRSFSKIEEKMATKTDIEGLKNKIEGLDKRMDDLSENRVKHEDHNKLKARVSFIEKKLEIR